MNILVIEDEPLVARDLVSHIKALEPASHIAAVLPSVDAALNWFSNNPRPDLILSDIQLSDGVSFDIFEKYQLNCPIIFTTAYDDYAIRAFKLNSIDYLLKPVDRQELASALAKYKSLNPENVLADQLKHMIGGWNQTIRKYKERFLCLQRNTLVPVSIQEIGYFHKEELIFLHTLSNERYISEHQTLDEIESLLNPDIFFRVNRQYIVHIQSVGRLKTTHKGMSVQLKSPFNVEMDMSREKVAAFKKWLGE